MTNSLSNPLPPSWAYAPLKDIADINPKLTKSDISDDLEVSFVPMTAVEELTGRIDLRECRRFAEVKRGYTPFQESDVLFAKITPCMENGKIAIVPALKNGHGFGSTEFHVLRRYEDVNPKYIYYFVSSLRFRSDAEHNMTGAVGQRRVPATYLSAQCIPVAPSREQDRIVAKLEELMSEIDRGLETLRTARRRLELYRLVVLHHAVGGATGSSHPSRPLGELIGPIGQGWSPKCDLNRMPRDGEWAIIKTTAVQPMSYVSHECKPLPANLEPRAGIEIRDGDLLMTRKGPRPRTGVVCYVRAVRPRSMLCDTVYRFRAVEDRVLPGYLEIALNSPSVVAEINARKSGTSDSGISLNHTKLHSLPVPVPADRAVQARIVREVESQLSLVEHVDALVDKETQRTRGLHQSLLRSAYSGRLVDQDSSDEPASALLERIRALRGGGVDRNPPNNKKGKRQAA